MGAVAASSEGPTKDLPEKGDDRGFQYGDWPAVVSGESAGGREGPGCAGGVPAGDVLVPVAAPGRAVRAGGRGADRGNGAVAAVFKPGAGVPPRPRHDLPVAGRGPDR